MTGPFVPRHRLAAILAVMLLATVASEPACAQYTWTSTTSGNWSDTANWMFNTPPPSAPATELVFSAFGTTSYTAVNDIANPFQLRTLTLDNEGTGTITIGPTTGGSLAFTGSSPEVLNFGAGAVSVLPAITLGSDLGFNGSGTGTVTFGGTLSDGGGGFGLNTATTTWAFNSAGASNLSFLRTLSGAVQITAGAWTLTNTSTADASAAVIIGRSSSGQTANFTLSGGATLTAPGGNILFGEVANSIGAGTVTGSGTAMSAGGISTGLIVVGNSGTGSLTISNGATVTSRVGFVGRNVGSTGTVIVDGAGSNWTTSGALTIGERGSGSLTVQGGATVSPGSVLLASFGGSNGTLTVTGVGSQLVTAGTGSITTQLASGLTVSSGGLISGHDVAIGSFGISATGLVNAGTLTVRNSLFVANGGTAGLTVQNGGVVTVAGSSAFVGTAPTNVGTIRVTGANSRLTMSAAGSFLIFGGGSGAGRGDLIVQNGGAVTSSGLQSTFAQDIGSSSVSVVDAGTVTQAGTLALGPSGTASLTVQNGGTVSAASVVLATVSSGASGTLTVTGAGSAVTATGVLRLAGSGTTPAGTATVNIAAGGSVSAAGLLTLFGGGTVNVNAGSLSAGGLTHGTATSIGNVNLSNGASFTITNGLGATYAGVISGAGSVTKAGAGTQTLTGVNTYTGPTSVNAGTLVLSGAGSIANSPTITVANGATLNVGGVSGGFALASGQALRGGGTVTGAVTAANGSSIAPGTPAGPDDLVVGGNLTLAPGSTLAARLTGNTAGTGYDQVAVTGTGAITLTGSTLTLTGTYSPLPADVLTIVLNGPNTPITGTFANPAVPGDPLGRLDLGGYYGNISYVGSGGTISGGNDVVAYNLVPVPEPGAILAMAAGGLAAAWLRRRRRG